MPERALVHQPDPSPRADRNVATRLQRISTEEKSGRTAAGNLCGTIGGSLGHGNSVILIHGLLNRTATKTGDHVAAVGIKILVCRFVPLVGTMIPRCLLPRPRTRGWFQDDRPSTVAINYKMRKRRPTTANPSKRPADLTPAIS